MSPNEDDAEWVEDVTGPYVGDFESRRYEGWMSLDDEQQDVVIAQGWRRFRVRDGGTSSDSNEVV